MKYLILAGLLITSALGGYAYLNQGGIGGEGTINQLQQWKFDGTYLTQSVTDRVLKFTGLESAGDCLVTDASGVVSTSACGSGGGGSNWTIIPGGLRTSTTTDFAQANHLIASDPTSVTTDEEPTRGSIKLQHFRTGVGTSTYKIAQDSYDILQINRMGDSTGDGDAWSLVNIQSPTATNTVTSVDSESTISLTTRSNASAYRVFDIYNDEYSRDNGMGFRQLYKSTTTNPIRFEFHDKTTNNGAWTMTGVTLTSGSPNGSYTSTSGVTPSAEDWIWDNAGTYLADDTKILSIDTGAKTFVLNRNATASNSGLSIRGKNIKEIMRLTPDRQLLVRKFIPELTTSVAEFGGETRTSGTTTTNVLKATSTTQASSIGYRLGIGTTTPTMALSVVGESLFSDNITMGQLLKINAPSGNPEFDFLENGTTRGKTYYDVTNNRLTFQNNETNSADALYFVDPATFTGSMTVDTNTLIVNDTSNRVGIGTSTPSQPLSVVGTTTMDRTEITSSLWLLGDYITNTLTWLDTKVEALTNVVLQGIWDFGGATSIEIVNGTAPTVDAIGEIAFDTTDNQFLIATSTVAGSPMVIPNTVSMGSFLIASTSMPFGSGFVTGKAIPFKVQRDGYNVTEIWCDIDGGTSIVINFDNGTGNTTSVTCDTDGASLVGVGANALVTAGVMTTAIETGTVTGSPDYLRVSVFGTYTRE